MNNMANDSEITVTTGKMVGLFVVLVVVCALFFGFGYAMGRGAAVSASNTNGGSIPAVVVMGQRALAKSSATVEAAADAPVSPEATGSTETHPAGSGVYFLQIAAVTKQEDAEALVAAL